MLFGLIGAELFSDKSELYDLALQLLQCLGWIMWLSMAISTSSEQQRKLEQQMIADLDLELWQQVSLTFIFRHDLDESESQHADKAALHNIS